MSRILSASGRTCKNELRRKCKFLSSSLKETKSSSKIHLVYLNLANSGLNKNIEYNELIRFGHLIRCNIRSLYIYMYIYVYTFEQYTYYKFNTLQTYVNL